MLFKSLFTYALMGVAHVSARRSCGTSEPTEEQNEIARTFQVKEANARQAGISARAVPIVIKVYWHVLATSRSVSGGYLTQATLNSQLDVLNDAYAPHDISFVQAGADWTVNTNWANDRSELAMKKALRKGTYADLNVYFMPGTQYLGYAYFPTTVTAGSNNFYYDGVVILSSSVPGGSQTKYNLGHTATHEIGHWLGLYHTFQGYSCTGNGDFISDTPLELEEAFDCQIGRDTCPNAPGTDPVTNYMDYSDDACFTGFTPGQETRIYTYWDQYRASYQ